uniref:guanylate kinase n=1 Tax=Picocystis salinarum TaxID=88271 RepID=A0A6U9QFU4_9CHLO|mmetsp:Transcript_6224/g.38653  ORF Transcript_6224/g.38653 Transcript_6224/m.38653 type:complete len:271 (+) Transcript_6224:36-848(+)
MRLHSTRLCARARAACSRIRRTHAMSPSAVDGGENPAARGPEETTDEEHASVVRKIEAQLGTKLSTTDASYHARDGAHVVVVSGPSGVGKDTVLRRLQEKRPDLLFVVTATSRAKRPGEVEGVDYFFVSKDEFERMIQDQELIEHAVVYGEYKGIPKKQIQEALDRGQDVILRIDVQGAETVRKLIPNCVSIFIVAENEKSLVKRLVSRQTEDFERAVVRVNSARSEMSRSNEFDYVVPNVDGKLEETVDNISAIIQGARFRVSRDSKDS